MKISVVIPNWNGAEKLKRNLPKVLNTDFVDEVIVSDDASTDNSIEVLETYFPKVKLIKNNKNGGFSSNVNTGVRNASGDLIFLLNSDAVPEKDCLKFVLPHFKNPRVFSVSCNTGGNWSWAHFKDGFFWHYMKEGKSETHQTLWSSGGGMVFKKNIWDSLGGLDEIFNPFYEEDVDLGYRATKRGFINIWENKARVEHYKDLFHSRSARSIALVQRTLPSAKAERKDVGVIEEHFTKQQIAKVAQRNQLLFIWKNITDKDFTKQQIFALIKMCLKHPKYIVTIFEALKRLNHIKQKRQIELKEEVISDREILEKSKNFK